MNRLPTDQKIPHSTAKVKSPETPLPPHFYFREPEVVARDLIGKHIVRVGGGQRIIGRIVESEAYRGSEDTASHARSGRTARNYPMFGPPGHAYVYFVYGMHWMFNIAAHGEHSPGAVLIRALEPVEGIQAMRSNRGGRIPQADVRLSNGPAKLSQALSIDAALNDADLCTPGPIYITAGSAVLEAMVRCGPRLRVPGDEGAQARPWRFWLVDSPYVST